MSVSQPSSSPHSRHVSPKASGRASLRLRSLRLATLVVALVGVLGVSEGVMRRILPHGLLLPMEGAFPWLVRQPIWGWTNQAGYRHEAFRINERFLRGPEIESSEPSEGLRVLCLGDSRTFGIWLDRGALRFDNDWPRLLAKRLRADEAAPPTQVLNLGVIGYTSSHVLRQLMTRLPNLDPDILIISVGMNDHVPSWNPTLRTRAPRSRLLDRLLGTFSEWRLVHLAFAAHQGLGIDQPDPFTVRWVEPEEYGQNLRRIVELAEARGLRLLFLHQGLRPLEMGDDLPAFRGKPPNSLHLLGATDLADLHRQHDQYRSRLEEVLTEHAVPWVDGPLFLGRGGAPPAFGPYDFVHLNDEGARQVAEALHHRLRDLGWL